MPLADAPLADELLLADAAPKTPPLTEAGTVVPFALAADALNAASVSEPVELNKVSTIVQLNDTTSPANRNTHGALITPTIPAWQCPGKPQ